MYSIHHHTLCAYVRFSVSPLSLSASTYMYSVYHTLSLHQQVHHQVDIHTYTSR